MTTIDVEIKFSNREFPRIFAVSSELDFTALKDAVKSTGAKFSDHTHRWTLTNKAALESLKAQFNVASRDFAVDQRNEVYFVATNEHIWSPPRFDAAGLPTDSRDYHDAAREVRNMLQVAYNVSDTELKAALTALQF